ncbi:MAG: MogA/MoaB family molybdenum cofactor biosynthesis protein [Coriobacteriia bacterium]|nr:MogA/MoaB family molybdenum cofactor biosynthesis protein [Coriobacteriia bacterium]MCL2746561.1 MogA/MoaB family molybdenum cofactor biosynthesis protein [Coriobacteriia bacterium]MCL2870704.1 MogA/MoaB family molybdenum cofactor biosynthesis protein [Coriobacteriia bacterium]
MKIAIVTCSDTRDITEDEAGQALAKCIQNRGWELAQHVMVKDDLQIIKAAFIQASDELRADVILSCGGTGLSARDVTPEATLAVADRIVPGISEAIRQFSLSITKRAMLSRALSAQRGTTLIINLPGSTKAALECFDSCADQLEHAVDMMAGKGH